MFISEEVEIFSGDYLNNPFGSKKDKRIESWLSILNKLPLIKEVNVNLQNQVSVDFHCEEMQEIEELLQLNFKIPLNLILYFFHIIKINMFFLM